MYSHITTRDFCKRSIVSAGPPTITFLISRRLLDGSTCLSKPSDNKFDVHGTLAYRNRAVQNMQVIEFLKCVFLLV